LAVFIWWIDLFIPFSSFPRPRFQKTSDLFAIARRRCFDQRKKITSADLGDTFGDELLLANNQRPEICHD
jgi:hypothetical protein